MLDMLIKIQETKITCDPEWGHLSAIKSYDRAESDYIDRDTSINKDYILYLLNVLKGDAFLLEWRRCKIAKEQKNIYLSEAIRNYNNALSKNDKSIAALYGLGLTIFNLATKSDNMVNDHQCDWDKIIDFENTQNDDQNPNGEPKYIPVKIKQSSDYTSEKREDVKKAIELMEKAELNGYDSTKIAFELGTMNEAINNNDEALLNYKKAYKKNYLAAGYQYCYLWIRNEELNKHTDLKTLEKKGVDEIVTILTEISSSDSNYSKASYALLWYIHRKISNFRNEDAQTFFSRTDKMTIKSLFENI